MRKLAAGLDRTCTRLESNVIDLQDALSLVPEVPSPRYSCTSATPRILQEEAEKIELLHNGIEMLQSGLTHTLAACVQSPWQRQHTMETQDKDQGQQQQPCSEAQVAEVGMRGSSEMKQRSFRLAKSTARISEQQGHASAAGSASLFSDTLSAIAKSVSPRGPKIAMGERGLNTHASPVSHGFSPPTPATPTGLTQLPRVLSPARVFDNVLARNAAVGQADSDRGRWSLPLRSRYPSPAREVRAARLAAAKRRQWKQRSFFTWLAIASKSSFCLQVAKKATKRWLRRTLFRGFEAWLSQTRAQSLTGRAVRNVFSRCQHKLLSCCWFEWSDWSVLNALALERLAAGYAVYHDYAPVPADVTGY
jgi:hypothetical protein